MRRRILTATISTAARPERRLAALVAAFVFVLQQALLPGTHASAWRLVQDHPHASDISPDHHHSGDGKSDGHDRQPCHFCRLLGAALPPPQGGLIARISVSVRIARPARTTDAPARPLLGRANPVRGPPRADGFRKIAETV